MISVLSSEIAVYEQTKHCKGENIVHFLGSAVLDNQRRNKHVMQELESAERDWNRKQPDRPKKKVAQPILIKDSQRKGITHQFQINTLTMWELLPKSHLIFDSTVTSRTHPGP